MRTRLAYSFALLLLTSLACPSFGGQATGDASAFVAALAQKALRSGGDKALTASDRQRGFETMLDEDFDLPRIARFVLGRYWQEATDADRQEFTAVFRDFMVRSYSQRFTEYSGESFRIVGQRAESATSTLVYSEIAQSGSGQVLKIDWRVGSGNGYRILDMTVGGVSMALTEREEFASTLQRSGGGVPSLIRQMQIKMSAKQVP